MWSERGATSTAAPPLPGAELMWASRKFDGSPHRRTTVRYLGTDDAGWWLLLEQGTAVESLSGCTPHPCDMITLLASDGPWHISWLDGFDPAIYVDVAVDTVVDVGGITSTDLDIDVVCSADGTVQIVDSDEFADNMIPMGYPSDLVAAVPLIADDIAAKLISHYPPFTELAPDRWRGRAAR
mgnify:CR=1 FL=1